MPYIDKTSRKAIEPELKALIKKLKSIPMEKVDGHINYCISTMMKELYSPSPARTPMNISGGGYFNYNRMMGVVACVQQELYRRLVAPYENKKIKENGDVF
ncbi:MAG: hypothetical protein HZA49_11200 [Planctomycetes bacterium]|nr:hypothetical protein [Planctomycetota bacterium]